MLKLKSISPVLRRVLPALLLLALIAGLLPGGAAFAQDTPKPETVTIPGTIQSKLGCSGDWQPECDKTFLTYDPVSDLWTGAFDLPVGSYEYKVALNKSWSENYGLKAKRDGPNIPLSVQNPGKVKFYYDHKTHWVTDSTNSVIAVAVGSFQTKLGCAKDNDPTCLVAWFEDPDGDGLYTFVTTKLPAGSYDIKIAINESMEVNYGARGVPDAPAIPFTVKKDGDEIYFGFNSRSHEITVSTVGAPHGNISDAAAQWVTKDTILWGLTLKPGYTFYLNYDPNGALTLDSSGVNGGSTLNLTLDKSPLDRSIALKFPYLSGYSVLKLDPADLDKIPEILKGQVVVSAKDANGRTVDATSIQIPGVLDDLFKYDGPLGITYDGDIPTIRLWAPTAKSVSLHLFADSKTETSAVVPMTADAKTGVWSVTGKADWTGKFYLYEVEVFTRVTNKVVKNLVTDPYSISLSMNSTRSQIVNLEDASLMPAGWKETPKPELAAPEDIVLYELHIRDFSVNDQSVPAEHRGTYLAFTDLNSNGMKHLSELQKAGLTHIHIMPAFDIASVNEDKSTWQTVDPAKLAAMPPDSDQQQAEVSKIKDTDGFNWGYDPYHYTTPEGSYSTNPDGSTRIVEFRQMVQALNQSGLRVVMDVVYNHTSASGQDEKSVLDKVVPGYYHRLNPQGAVETSTCCQNTATEHAMMEKLMIDSLVTWAKEYKVDGFRFDLMGHHMVYNMANVRKALDALTLEKDGVDGSKIYIYGEGWDFGEVAGMKRGMNATQINLSGSGIGTFNDRLRDAAKGGSPFDKKQKQGFITGLYFDPNELDQGSDKDQLATLLHYEDLIKAGLAGNLKDFQLTNMNGNKVSAEQILYGNVPAAYTADPQENIVYVSAHDNEILFDAVQEKAPTKATVADRVRMVNLGNDLVLLSQGVPFFTAGDDILRSKSLDGNSYNSGDWFNNLDFTMQTNNWGVGLPAFNTGEWPWMKTLLGNPALKPGPSDILFAFEHFKEMLQIRKSSKLFRLETAKDIKQRLTFLNNGPDGIPGLIVMDLQDVESDRRDPTYSRIVVLFNATTQDVKFSDESFKGFDFTLHPVQANSTDPILKNASFDQAGGSLSVPARTTVVFVATRFAQALAPTAAPTLLPAPTATTAPAAPPTALAAQPTQAEAPAAQPQGIPAAWLLGGSLLAVILVGLGIILVRRKK